LTRYSSGYSVYQPPFHAGPKHAVGRLPPHYNTDCHASASTRYLWRSGGGPATVLLSPTIRRSSVSPARRYSRHLRCCRCRIATHVSPQRAPALLADSLFAFVTPLPKRWPLGYGGIRQLYCSLRCLPPPRSCRCPCPPASAVYLPRQTNTRASPPNSVVPVWFAGDVGFNTGTVGTGLPATALRRELFAAHRCLGAILFAPITDAWRLPARLVWRSYPYLAYIVPHSVSWTPGRRCACRAVHAMPAAPYQST